MALRNQPYFPLYVADYSGDEKLIQCSASSQGVYIRLLCLFHKSDEYGGILLKQKNKQNESNIENFVQLLSKILPFDFNTVADAIVELIDEKVLHIEGDFLFQKRMVKDNKISIARSEAGKTGGGNPILFKQKVKQANKQRVKQITVSDNVIVNDIEYKYTFENVWNLYDKKINKSKGLEAKWNELTKEEKDKALIHIPQYVLSTPDKQYRKHFETYLNKKSFNDEILGYEAPEEIKLGKQNNSLSDEELAKYASI